MDYINHSIKIIKRLEKPKKKKYKGKPVLFHQEQEKEKKNVSFRNLGHHHTPHPVDNSSPD